MIFEQDSIVFKILDVIYFEQINAKTNSTKRSFDALSFRYEADTVIHSNNKEICLKDNSISFFPSEVGYIRSAKKDKMIVINFKVFNYSSQNIEYLYPDSYEKYADLFKNILDIWNAKSPSYKYECAAILNNIFAELYKDNKSLNEYKKSKISESIQYIKANFLKKDFSLQIAAEKSFMSETYFRKLFKKEFGVSPKKYVIERRIKYAASLIMAGYFSLQEISQMCGYDDYKHFSSEFKKIMNVSPSKYTYKF